MPGNEGLDEILQAVEAGVDGNSAAQPAQVDAAMPPDLRKLLESGAV